MGVLDGKVGIVTGAAQGIGKGMATALAKEGMAVTITDIQADKVAATGAELRAQGLKVLDVVADGCSDEQVNNAVARTVEEFGSIFLLVNCAQTAVNDLELQDQTVETVSVGMDSGFWASFRYMKACFPYLKESQGTVVNFGSQAGLLGNWGMTGYNCAKEAIRGLTRTAAREWGKYNITVNNIIPGHAHRRVAPLLRGAPRARGELARQHPDGPLRRAGAGDRGAGGVPLHAGRALHHRRHVQRRRGALPAPVGAATEHPVGLVEGKIAFITGVARGQGRSHAVRLAQEGADVIGVDICADIASIPYPMATEAELEETAQLIEATGRRAMLRTADVRDFDRLEAVVAEGLAEFGHIDVVCANAGVAIMGPPATKEQMQATWDDVIGTNLTGVWNTARAVAPSMLERNAGGSIIITSSTAGLKAMSAPGHIGGEAYGVAKHGLVGLMRSLAVELSPASIRVNTIHPTGVNTMMTQNEAIQAVLAQIPEDMKHSPRSRTCCRWRCSSRVTSATRWCSWHPTRPGTSPA